MISFVFFSVLLCGFVKAQHGYYNFPQSQSYTDITSILVWKVHKYASPVYLATMFYTNLNAGYFGMASGAKSYSSSQEIKAQFSIWHHKDQSGAVVPNAEVDPYTSWCRPFGNEGSGIHCDIKITLQMNANYQFEVRRTSTGNGKTTWDCYMWTNQDKGKVIGRIALKDVRGVASDHFHPNVGSFMEYFGTQKNFETGAGWTGPFFNNGVGPNMCNSDCDMADGLHRYIDACIPGQTCGYPHVYFNVGGSRSGCHNNLWNQYEGENNTTKNMTSAVVSVNNAANPKLWTKILYEMWNQTGNASATIKTMNGSPRFQFSKIEKRKQN